LSTGDSSDWHEVAAAIHSSGRKLVLAVTGGGSGAISALLQTPGASRTILEAVVPYSLSALADWIGGQPDQACSEATARAMAMAAFARARQLAPEANPNEITGIGATASLATDRPKRGERRIHFACQRHDRTFEGFSSFELLPADRAGDEWAAAEVLLATIANECGAFEQTKGMLRTTGHGVQAPLEQTELLAGKRRRAVLQAGSDVDYFDEGVVPPITLLFPGAFNPLHTGHLRMAEIAERSLGRVAAWELSIANVDKPPLDFISIDERLVGLRQRDANRMIALTLAPTFREKSELFPGAAFIVGADTMLRIAEPRYYGGEEARRDAAIAEIARHGCRFLVFGREMDGRFVTLSDLDLPAPLRSLCDEIPAEEFREDVSSTELRAHLAPDP
jgi:hypothetical protein